MDEIRRNTIAIIGVAVLMLTTGTTTKVEPAPHPEPEPVAYVYGDQYGAPAQAVQTLVQHLQNLEILRVQSTTTTVTEYRYTEPDATMWDTLAACESSGNWSHQPVAGGFSGGLMFHIGTWRAMGGLAYAPDAYLATREQQIDIAERTRTAARGSMRDWPGCARKHGWQ